MNSKCGFPQDQVVWITGASSGIGEALCYEFASRGARLILSSRRIESLQAVRERCAKWGDSHHVIPMDLSIETSIRSAVREAQERFPTIDVLVNNAGISQRCLAAETPIDVDRRILEVNFFGTVTLTKTLLPFMMARRAGQIVVVSSVVGKFGFPLRSAYAASKHALHGFFESLRLELKDSGISITLVCPGRVSTLVSVHALNREGKEHSVMDEHQQRGMRADVCARKILRAIARKEKELVIGRKESLLALAKRYAPNLFDHLIRRVKAT